MHRAKPGSGTRRLGRMLEVGALAAVFVSGAALSVPVAAAGALLLANGDFDSDVVPWADPFPDADTVISWSAIDASGASPSGSMQIQTNISNGASDGPISECLPASPGTYSLSSEIFNESSAGQVGCALIEVSFYDSVTCDGVALDSANAFADGLDAWVPTAVDAEAPLGTAGIRVRAFVGCTTDSVPDIARFDEIQLVPEPAGTAGVAAASLGFLAWRRRQQSD